LVERVEDPSDRRAKLIHMTTAGEKVCRQTMEIAAKISARVMRNVSDEELLLCLDVLDRVDQALSELRGGDRKTVRRSEELGTK
jgi:MarR family transcriptional regulator for hemolysin